MQVEPRATIVFDGTCTFCRRWIARWQNAARYPDRIEYIAYQDALAAGRFTHVAREQFGRAIHLFEAAGRSSRGAEAVFRSLHISGANRWLAALYAMFPPFAWIAELVYRFVARHRNGMDRLDGWLIGFHIDRPSTFAISRWLYLRAIGVIFLIAFASLWTQVHGLIGSRGILPIASYLPLAREALGPVERYWQLPTLCWISASDSMLTFLCAGGVACASLLILDIATPIALALCWISYLSLTVAGQIFLSFQWDALLLETALMAMFVAPWKLRPSLPRDAPSKLGLFMQKWLLFRLMFLSGVVKLSAGDEVWWNLTALKYHYETQPLPTWTSWWMHQSPLWMHRFAAGGTFAIELLVPLLFFGPRRLRLLACWLAIALQLTILATGNYGFFNLLTIALCLPLIDDAFFTRWKSRLPKPAPSGPGSSWRRWSAAPIAFLILFVTTLQLIDGFTRTGVEWPSTFTIIQSTLAPFRSTNSYGLFRVMTRTRPEIIIQGSNDGLAWKSYTFKYKPNDDLSYRPRFCTPHMPRLDWQMWFAALGDVRKNPWLVNFEVRLLQGSPDVVVLLKENPFPDRPPRYVRALIYDYHFTDREERARTGNWWKRELLGDYCPPISLRE